MAADSIYGILHRERFTLFPDEMFAGLFDGGGRRSVPMIVAVVMVMVLQRIEGCSDREAADRFAFDARWKYAAGGWTLIDYPGFAHTVLVDMRARLARSAEPDRIFQVTLEVAGAAGLVGRRRVVDSTPLSGWSPDRCKRATRPASFPAWARRAGGTGRSAGTGGVGRG